MEEDPLSLKCELVLKQPLTKDRCFDFSESRRWAMCRSWEIFEKQKIPFSEARKLAWEELKKKCAEIGAYI
jgi:hypothetical protein